MSTPATARAQSAGVGQRADDHLDFGGGAPRQLLELLLLGAGPNEQAQGRGGVREQPLDQRGGQKAAGAGHERGHRASACSTCRKISSSKADTRTMSR